MKQASIRNFFGTPAPDAGAGASQSASATASAAVPSAAGAAKRKGAPAPTPAPAPKQPAHEGARSGVTQPSFLEYASPADAPSSQPVPKPPSPLPPLAFPSARGAGAAEAPTLSAEQRMRIDAKRQAALERRAARDGASTAASPVLPAGRPPSAAGAHGGGSSATGNAADPKETAPRRRLIKRADLPPDDAAPARASPDAAPEPKRARRGAAERARAKAAAAAASSAAAGSGSEYEPADSGTEASAGEEEDEEEQGSEEESKEAGPRARSRGANKGRRGAAAPRARAAAPPRRAGGGGGSSSGAAPSARAATPAAAAKRAPSPSPASGVASAAAPAAADGGGVWESAQPRFLAERLDAQKRPPSHPEFDERTIFIPAHELKSLTAAQQQYWTIKKENMDTVLFFKMGKFYELFEDDAHVGHRELELNYMGKGRPHTGFPEAALSKYAEQLVGRGYRVGVVEQTETPAQLALRNKEAKARDPRAKQDKAVRRELCSMLSAGTLTSAELAGPETRWLLAITQEAPAAPPPPPQQSDATARGGAASGAGADGGGVLRTAGRFGVCLLDAAANRIVAGSFEDSPTHTRLRTLLAECCPAEALLDAEALSADASLLVRLAVPRQQVSAVRGADAFWGAERTAAELSEARYFDGSAEGWPRALREWAPEGARVAPARADADGSAPAGAEPPALDALAMRALGGCVRYLRRLLLDAELLSLGRVEHFAPAGAAAAGSRAEGVGLGGARCLALDSQALANLEVLANSADGGRRGTLLDTLDRTCTVWGARALRGWLCRPLAAAADIRRRQAAIAELIATSDELGRARVRLRKLPDLERLLARIHSLGAKRTDERATFYGDVPKQRLRELIKTLRALRELHDVVLQELAPRVAADEAAAGTAGGGCADGGWRSALLVHACTPGLGYPADVDAALSAFERRADWDAAWEHGRVRPPPGADVEFDEAQAAVSGAEAALERERSAVADVLGERVERLPWFMAGGASARESFQVEVSESVLERFSRSGGHLPAQWTLMSSKKGYRRFHTPGITAAIAELELARGRLEEALRAVSRKLFTDFAAQHALWSACVRCVSELDCLMSLAIASASTPGLSRPTIVERADVPGGGAMLAVRGGWHLCSVAARPGGLSSFVPNDLALGAPPDGLGDARAEPLPRCALITGPNMGGKSTVLRQTALIVLMAQLGAHVPAAHAELTPADAIYTRVGAADRILAGQSTFRVELEEASEILHGATADSLVILDELGRGTATFDGMAIADAVLSRLARATHCRTLFATHYHLLARQYEGPNPHAALYRMACAVDEASREVTFLYRLERGACSRSHGVNVARLAGLPPSLLKCAASRSEHMEAAHNDVARGAEGASTRARAAELGRQVAAATAAASRAGAPPAAAEAALAELRALQAEARALLAHAARASTRDGA